MKLPLLYVFCALIATLINIGTQHAVVTAQADALMVSILFGTITGLISKYLLDKIVIFKHTSKSLAEEKQLFLIYSVNGLFTTGLFWAVEFTFHLVFGSPALRYLGACIGLAMGYWVKYKLDKRFVFNNG